MPRKERDMAKQPRQTDGRLLPHQDWEGDDSTPGAGGKMVTCTDTSAGRALSYATNGRKDLDGKVIRAAVHPHDVNGLNLSQAKRAIESLTNTTLVIPQGWDWDDLFAHLKAKKGAVVQGWYSAIPRSYRFQSGVGAFGHAIWVSHYSPTSGMRVWDALDANLTHHGQWVPAKHIRAFAEDFARREGQSSLFVGYVPLGPLVV